MTNLKMKLIKNSIYNSIIENATIAHLRINLTKEMQDLYTENYMMSLKEIKDLNKWEDIFVPGLEQ